MKSNRFKHRLFLAAGIIIVSLIAYLSAGAASTTRTFTWAPRLTLDPGQVLTAEPNGDGVFRVWGLCPGCSDKYGSGLQQSWVEDNWPDAVDLVDLDGDGQVEVAAVIGAWQGRKGPYTIWVNAYHQVNGSSFTGNSFWATSYYAPNYEGSLSFPSATGFLAAGGNLILESSEPRLDELAVAAGNRVAVFAYRGLVEAGTPAITRLFEATLPGSVKGLTAGDLNGDGVDELVVLTYDGQNSILRVVNVNAAETDLTPPLATWTGINEGWKMPVIGDANSDETKEIWVHSQPRPVVDGVLRAFQLGSETQVATIPGLGPYDRFTVGPISGPVSGMTKDVIALFKIDPTGNTVKLVTLDNTFSNELSIPGSPAKGQIAHNQLYITGYGSGGRTGGTFLLQVFDIGLTGGLSLRLTASRVGGVRGEVEPTDLAVVP